MHKTHTLETLNGLNPNTARKLFSLLSEEWDGVSWGDFRTYCGRDLACFASDSRWIPGDLFRDYFADRSVEAGRAFVRLYSKRAHRPSRSAYAKGNGNGSTGRKGAVKSALKSGSASKGRKVTASGDARSAILAALSAVNAEIASKGINDELRERVNTLAQTLVNMDA